MVRPAQFLLLAILLLGLASSAVAVVGDFPTPRHRDGFPQATVAGRVIVKFRSTQDRKFAMGLSQHVRSLSQRMGIPLQAGRRLGERTAVLTANGIPSGDLATSLRRHPEVEWVEVDGRKFAKSVQPNDAFYAQTQVPGMPSVGQWYLHAPVSPAVAAIDAPGAWNITKGLSSVVVAVIDTGVRLAHPDLLNKLLPGYDFIAEDSTGIFSTAADGNGRDPDPSDPGDWTGDGDCGIGSIGESSSWHGTQVAGLIGASTDNSIGIASIGWNIKLLPVRVLGACGGFDSDIIAGMRWAGGLSDDVSITDTPLLVHNSHPAQVLNLSLGSTGQCTSAYQEVINDLVAAKVVVVAAAGNDLGHAVNSPANCLNVISVGGVRHTGTKIGYSNLGPEVTVSAPAGNCVNPDPNSDCLYPLITTSNNGVADPVDDGYSGGNYRLDSLLPLPSLGTSFATSLVSGTVALMLSVDPGLLPADIKKLIAQSASPFPQVPDPVGNVSVCSPADASEPHDQLECFCTTQTCGAGLLNAAKALQMTNDRLNAGVNPPWWGGSASVGLVLLLLLASLGLIRDRFNRQTS